MKIHDYVYHEWAFAQIIDFTKPNDKPQGYTTSNELVQVYDERGRIGNWSAISSPYVDRISIFVLNLSHWESPTTFLLTINVYDKNLRFLGMVNNSNNRISLKQRVKSWAYRMNVWAYKITHYLK